MRDRDDLESLFGDLKNDFDLIVNLTLNLSYQDKKEKMKSSWIWLRNLCENFPRLAFP